MTELLMASNYIVMATDVYMHFSANILSSVTTVAEPHSFMILLTQARKKITFMDLMQKKKKSISLSIILSPSSSTPSLVMTESKGV